MCKENLVAKRLYVQREFIVKETYSQRVLMANKVNPKKIDSQTNLIAKETLQVNIFYSRAKFIVKEAAKKSFTPKDFKVKLLK